MVLLSYNNIVFWSYLVHFGLIRSIPVNFSPLWSNRSIQFTLINFSPIGPLVPFRSNLVNLSLI